MRIIPEQQNSQKTVNGIFMMQTETETVLYIRQKNCLMKEKLIQL